MESLPVGAMQALEYTKKNTQAGASMGGITFGMIMPNYACDCFLNLGNSLKQLVGTQMAESVRTRKSRRGQALLSIMKMARNFQLDYPKK